MRKSARQHPDRILLMTVATLVVSGLFIFLSASLGLLAYDGAKFSSVARSQLIFGLGGGLIAFFFCLAVPYRVWKRFSLHIFGASIVLTLLVFIPHLGLTLNGATRWIHIGPITLQPSEFLKIAYILYLATWFSNTKSKINTIGQGLIPFGIITAITGAALLAQPDTDTFVIIAVAGGAMFMAAGARIKHLAILAGAGICLLIILVSFRPYLADRLTTFLHPTLDPRGTSYQVQQSLLAVGAGETFGRGFGQSIQKFGKLPEPISDSIFSVFAEEFGFVGGLALILVYITFALRGLWVAARTPDMFGGLVAVGIVVLITAQSFLNIGAMLALLPLSGLPLVFVSHGGTALLVSLGAAGILLSISRSITK
ncbi:MAG: cell division protein FtsW [Candidatus Pacebacteria bacterium]|nr:cell division protein FtsW [Candidatus Paceibacterota bacterium]MBP9831976.1 cell division protein FtsW [Candidatus Paceibacterota bacterium]